MTPVARLTHPLPSRLVGTGARAGQEGRTEGRGRWSQRREVPDDRWATPADRGGSTCPGPPARRAVEGQQTDERSEGQGTGGEG